MLDCGSSFSATAKGKRSVQKPSDFRRNAESCPRLLITFYYLLHSRDEAEGTDEERICAYLICSSLNLIQLHTRTHTHTQTIPTYSKCPDTRVSWTVSSEKVECTCPLPCSSCHTHPGSRSLCCADELQANYSNGFSAIFESVGERLSTLHVLKRTHLNSYYRIFSLILLKHF